MLTAVMLGLLVAAPDTAHAQSGRRSSSKPKPKPAPVQPRVEPAKVDLPRESRDRRADRQSVLLRDCRTRSGAGRAHRHPAPHRRRDAAVRSAQPAHLFRRADAGRPRVCQIHRGDRRAVAEGGSDRSRRRPDRVPLSQGHLRADHRRRRTGRGQGGGAGRRRSRSGSPFPPSTTRSACSARCSTPTPPPDANPPPRDGPSRS